MDVERKQRKIATWALDPDFRFNDIYNFITYEDWLRRAFLSVKKNAGSRTAGVDGETISDFEDDLEENIQALAQQLDSETYDPDPTRRVYIPKGNGEKRPLSIPTVRDRIVQEALRMLLEPIYESDFSDYSLGFRPGRSAHDAIKVVQGCLNRAGQSGYSPWIIDADISGFFDNVSHTILEQRLRDRITQEKVRDLIWKFLKAGVMEGNRMKETVAGTPQGGILSPLLANIYLDQLDQAVKPLTDLTMEEMARRRASGKGNWTYVRYADDFLLLTNGTRKRAEQKLQWTKDFVERELKLTLNEKKTSLTHGEDGGIEFLGYRIEPSHPKQGGGAKTKVPRRAIQDVKTAIRRRCGKDASTDVSTRNRMRGLNSVLRGWAEYYKYATQASKVFPEVQSFAWQKMSCWLAKKFRCSRKTLFSDIAEKTNPIRVNGMEMVYIPGKGNAKWHKPLKKDHPYFDGTATRREPTAVYQIFENEHRTGHRDLRWKVFRRDDWTCQECGKKVSWYDDGELHHLEYSGKPVDAETLCADCHAEKDPHRHVG